MKSDRREFIKIFGLGSAGMMAFPLGMSAAELQENDIIRNEESAVKFTRKKMQADVLVAGGGLAGVCAAIAAARNGASVILVQDRSRLGGNASSEIRMHVLGANNPGKLRLWRETGIIEELKLTEAATNLQRSFHMWDLILYDKVISEENITLLLDTAVIDAAVQNEQITSALAVSPLLEEYYEIDADFYIDCTGDATLSAVSGAKYMRGREGQDVYGESLAPAESDEKTMGNSLLFFSKKHDRPMPFTPPEWAHKFTKEDFKHRPIRSWEYGYWWIEWGGELDTIKDNREIRRELLKIVMGVWDYIKNSGEHPTSKNWALDFIGMIPGKRENRRILGEHVMTQQELQSAEEYPDRVAYGGWPMDDHPPGGFYRRDERPARQIYFEQPYNVPLRSLYSINRPNLLMAGRDVSASHVAFSSTRVMATCATFGQAAGTAAAYCEKHQLLPTDIANRKKELQLFQQLLLKDDQSLLNIRNEDPGDLARKAEVTASAETDVGKAVNILDGWNRDIGDGNCHEWQAPMGSLSQWIELRWKKPQSIREIQITFDSGLHRRLYLSGQDGEYYSQIRDAQPELAADYSVEVKQRGKFTAVAEVDNNYLRLRRHRFDPVRAGAVRINIHRTQGDDLARIFEVRCYS